MNFILTWLINALAIVITAYILPWVTVSSFWIALVAAAVLAIINVVIKPLALLLTLPINILTLGLFTFVINGVLILLADQLIDGFDVGGFWSAVLFSVILGVVNGLLGQLKGSGTGSTAHYAH